MANVTVVEGCVRAIEPEGFGRRLPDVRCEDRREARLLQPEVEPAAAREQADHLPFVHRGHTAFTPGQQGKPRSARVHLIRENDGEARRAGTGMSGFSFEARGMNCAETLATAQRLAQADSSASEIVLALRDRGRSRIGPKKCLGRAPRNYGGLASGHP